MMMIAGLEEAMDFRQQQAVKKSNKKGRSVAVGSDQAVTNPKVIRFLKSIFRLKRNQLWEHFTFKEN